MRIDLVKRVVRALGGWEGKCGGGGYIWKRGVYLEEGGYFEGRGCILRGEI